MPPLTHSHSVCMYFAYIAPLGGGSDGGGVAKRRRPPWSGGVGVVFMQWLLVENNPLVVHVEISLIVWDCPAVDSMNEA